MIGLDGGVLDTGRLTGAGHAAPIDRAGLSGPGGIDWAGPAGSDGINAGNGRRSAIVVGAGGRDVEAYRELRREVFVGEQAIFNGSDLDELDESPSTVVVVAHDRSGAVIGGVRVAPVGGDPKAGWWAGSRLVVAPGQRRSSEVGGSLVRAACAVVEGAGALRFDAAVQPPVEAFFHNLGWLTIGERDVAGLRHLSMRWPIDRAARLARATKAPLAAVLDGLQPGGTGWIGDDAAPVAGSDLLAACDAIVPAMVERDPDWAGWCGVVVNVNDLAAMGATPVALLDAVAAPTQMAAQRVLSGLRRAADAYGVAVIGGHTQLGVPSALSVTAIGRTSNPVPGGGGQPGDDIRLTVDLGGDWRSGYHGAQWDSTSTRSPAELRHLVGTVARMAPAAAKDVSMAGIIGTLGMLAEASGCGAELDVAAVPRPATANLGDWMTCFPGFAMLSAERPGTEIEASTYAPAVTARCGRLVAGAGVTLVWPDGARTTAIDAGVTGLGSRWQQ